MTESLCVSLHLQPDSSFAQETYAVVLILISDHFTGWALHHQNRHLTFQQLSL